jgi:spermidine synthase
MSIPDLHHGPAEVHLKRLPIPLLFFAFSGASGLIYEVVWTRLFELVAGSSHQSVTLVVATFMGGLALGSFLGGKAADRVRSPLRLYGLLVLITGAWCFLVPGLLEIARPFFGAVYRLHDGEPTHPLFVAAKLLASAAILLVPTTLMGATLPALARHVTRETAEAGPRLGLLYAANTLGAVAGAWAGGFLLIPRIGLWWTSSFAAAVDVAIGLLALSIARPIAAARPAARPRPTAAASPSASALDLSRSRSVLIAAAFGLSGMADMCLQLGWTRTLILSLGSSTYAFSAIVGIFILGLAAGSAAGAACARKLRSPQAALGWTMTAVAAIAASTIPAFGTLAPAFARRIEGMEAVTFPRFIFAGALWSSALIFPAAFFMGMTFPIVGRLVVRDLETLGRRIGRAYLANTLGSIVGTLAVGFVILPLTGRLWAPLYIAVAVGLAAGLALVVLEPSEPGRRRRRIVLACGTVAALLAHAAFTRPWGVLDPGGNRRHWDPVSLNLGPFIRNPLTGIAGDAEDLEKRLRESYDVLYSRDGEAASVAVFHVKGTDFLELRINGKVDASVGGDSPDVATQLLLGHLPLLARPGARSVLAIGLGSGITVGSMAAYPVEGVTCLEISPEVAEAARLFAAVNRGAVDSPRVRLVIGDGRNHLQHTAARYDVICSEPSNLWIAGMSNLFTREFYEEVKGRLAPGGVACQWIQGYSLRASDLGIALRTFAAVFPHVSVWAASADILLLGSTDPVRWDRDWMARCLSLGPISADLVPIGIDRPEALFRYLRIEDADARRLAGSGPENRDLFPRLEYSAPLALFDIVTEAALVIMKFQAAPVTGDFASIGGPAVIEAYRTRGVLLDRMLLDLSGAEDGRLFGATVDLFLKLPPGRDAWLTASLVRQLKRSVATGPSMALLFRRLLLASDDPALDGAFRGLKLKEVQIPREMFERAAREAAPGDWTPLLLQAADEGGRDPAAALRFLKEAEARGAPREYLERIRSALDKER